MSSPISRICIVLIALGFSFMIGVRLYRMYSAQVEEQSQQHSAGVSAQFRSGGAPEKQLPVFQRTTVSSPEIYLQETQLPDELKQEQARQTIQSILADYQEDEALKSFYADLQKSTGEAISLVDLSGEGMAALLIKHPEIQEVIARHTQDPAFAKTLQEIFSNPQFGYSVAVLQQRPRK